MGSGKLRSEVALVTLRTRAEAPEDGGRDVYESLHARLAIVHCRGLRLAVLRPLAGAALPLWLHWLQPFLPGWLVWPLLLIQGLLLSLLLAYTLLETRWTFRLARRRGPAVASGIHVASKGFTDFRFGLLDAVALLSIGPWLAACCGPSRAAGALSEAMNAGLLIAVAAFVLETVADCGQLQDQAPQAFPPSRAGDMYGPGGAG